MTVYHGAARRRESEETRSSLGRVSTMTRLSPVGAVWRGVLAGAVGTVAMDLVWFYRYRRGGGESGFLDWELSTAPSSWESAPAPAQIGRRLIEAVFHRQIPVEHAALVNDVMHWSYGLFWGAGYGIGRGIGRGSTATSGWGRVRFRRVGR